MTFRVGQKVACVDASGNAASVMKVGDIFTILGPGIHADCIEVSCKPINDRAGSRGWLATRFRPVTSRKTDISIFKRLLVPGSKNSEPV